MEQNKKTITAQQAKHNQLLEKTSFKRLFRKNIYLLLTAAWLVTISFIIDNYWAGNSSLKAVQTQIEIDIQNKEIDFVKLLKDSSLVSSMDNKAFEEPALLRAGNSGSVYFAVNGLTYGPAAPGAQVVKNVVLSPEALTAAYALAEPTGDVDLARFVSIDATVLIETPTLIPSN